METKVRIVRESYRYNVIKGDIGYVDGYLQDSDNVPCAVVIIGKSFNLVPLHMIEVYEYKND